MQAAKNLLVAGTLFELVGFFSLLIGNMPFAFLFLLLGFGMTVVGLVKKRKLSERNADAR